MSGFYWEVEGGGGFTWRVFDCEELVGLLTGDDWFEYVRTTKN